MIELSVVELWSWLNQFFYPFIRVSSILFAIPGFGHRATPKRVKILFAMLLCYLIIPVLPTPAPQVLNAPIHVMFVIQELLLGAAIGLGARIVFSAFDAAGDFVGTQVGLSFASFIDPQHSRPMPIFASFFSILASLLFFSSNCHLLVIQAIYNSFYLFPMAGSAGSVFEFAQQIPKLIIYGGMIFSLGLQLALPIVASQLMANILLGMLARASPQLNIISLGFPVTLLTGIFFIYLSLPTIVSIIEHRLVLHLNNLLNGSLI